jgi:general stress protein 26
MKMAKKSLKERIMEIMKKNQFAVLATITGDGKPWARYVASIADEDFNIRFATDLDSRKVAQIKKNPEVHMTLGAQGSDYMGSYLQVQGKAKVSSAAKAKKEFWTDGLNHYFKGPDDPNYVVITVKPYLIELEDESRKRQVWTRTEKK